MYPASPTAASRVLYLNLPFENAPKISEELVEVAEGEKEGQPRGMEDAKAQTRLTGVFSLETVERVKTSQLKCVPRYAIAVHSHEGPRSRIVIVAASVFRKPFRSLVDVSVG